MLCENRARELHNYPFKSCQANKGAESRQRAFMSLFDVVGLVGDDTHPSAKFVWKSTGLALEGQDSPEHFWYVQLCTQRL